MPASEAQIRANRENSARSTGPTSTAGKEKSRANALKHGLTGEGVALTNEDAAEVERVYQAFEADFRPTDEMGRILIRRMATCTVRMERSVLQESAALNERVLAAQVEAEASGEDPVMAGRRAMFDPSKEACLARKYEAAAERGFFKAYKEFRQHQGAADVPSMAKAEAASARKSMEQLASFFPEVNQPPAPAKPAPAPARPASTPAPAPARPASAPVPARVKTVFPVWNPVFKGSVDVPISAARPR